MSLRSNISYLGWEIDARIRHRFGQHTFFPIEEWTKEGGVDIITIIGEECWLCPTRR
jgi:hypothetical protein